MRADLAVHSPLSRFAIVAGGSRLLIARRRHVAPVAPKGIIDAFAVLHKVLVADLPNEWHLPRAARAIRILSVLNPGRQATNLRESYSWQHRPVCRFQEVP